jgi:hypothetical protein
VRDRSVDAAKGERRPTRPRTFVAPRLEVGAACRRVRDRGAGGTSPTIYLVLGVFVGLGLGPDGAGCGQLTGIVFGVGR